MRGLRRFETERSRALRRTSTSAENKLWAKLRGRRLGNLKFVRQENIGPCFADFLCRERRLMVEVDGATDSTPAEVVSDARREAFFRAEGFRIMRVSNDEVINNLDGVCETILVFLASK
jgi:very-short-patch-repair endonuclease